MFIFGIKGDFKMTEYTHMFIGYALSYLFYMVFLQKHLTKMRKKLKKMKKVQQDIPELADAISFSEFLKNKNS